VLPVALASSEPVLRPFAAVDLRLVLLQSLSNSDAALPEGFWGPPGVFRPPRCFRGPGPQAQVMEFNIFTGPPGSRRCTSWVRTYSRSGGDTYGVRERERAQEGTPGGGGAQLEEPCCPLLPQSPLRSMKKTSATAGLNKAGGGLGIPSLPAPVPASPLPHFPRPPHLRPRPPSTGRSTDARAAFVGGLPVGIAGQAAAVDGRVERLLQRKCRRACCPEPSPSSGGPQRRVHDWEKRWEGAGGSSFPAGQGPSVVLEC
jgi:hypothetical protein